MPAPGCLGCRITRDALAEVLSVAAPGLLIREPPEPGMKLLARLGGGRSDVAVARAATEVGIVARAVSPVRRIAAGSVGATISVKRLAGLAATGSLDAQLDAKGSAFVGAAGTADFREGVMAFFERRSPRLPD